jgi:RNA polymerase sigma factor for flagellar operon FliA
MQIAVWLFLYLSGAANSGDLSHQFPIAKPKQEGRMSRHKRQRMSGELPAGRASPEELAERHLSLVIPIARNFQKRLPSSVDFGDLVGAGNLGLVEAARRFNLAKGTSFRTFARHRIRGAITDSLRQIDPVSRYLRSQQKAAERATTELMAILGRCPTEAEIARRLHLSLPRWRKLRWELHEAGCPVNGHPMNGAVAPADPDKLPGTWADPVRLMELTETHDLLYGAIGTLPTRYRQVLHLYDFEEWTMQQIGIRLAVHESRVSQLRAAALARMRVQLVPRLAHRND